MGDEGGVLVIGLRTATFALSIFGALVALQLYNLTKSTAGGHVWRAFILGALVFSAWALAGLSRTLFPGLFDDERGITLFMDLLQAVFIVLFSLGLWQQRQNLFRPADRHDLRPLADGEDELDLGSDD